MTIFFVVKLLFVGGLFVSLVEEGKEVDASMTPAVHGSVEDIQNVLLLFVVVSNSYTRD